ncbi:uncharacterized protein CBL_10934 [Carabus blaptoides fortunei]
MLVPIIFIYSLITMSKCDLTDYFPDIDGNLTKITWAHAVNNISLLETALAGKVMMLEADISLGTVGNNSTVIPIMAHPPANKSDLSLQDFFVRLSNFNANKTKSGEKKGAKLDFKTIEAFEKSTEILKNITQSADYPIWLNADIVSGPVNASTKPVDANKFLKMCQEFPKNALSIGWTTAYNSSFANHSHSYTDEQIEDMLKHIKDNGMTGREITFPVRAGLAAESLPQMQKLIETVKKSTLTIWSSAGDPVNVNDLNTLILKIGVDKVYIDVPEELEKKLNLGSSSNRAAHISVFSVVLSTMAAFSDDTAHIGRLI